jgi:hypothetical protein
MSKHRLAEKEFGVSQEVLWYAGFKPQSYLLLDEVAGLDSKQFR